ncbi:MAG: hypothetical protein ABEL76_11850 [Bradymonadaceae bacterium]
MQSRRRDIAARMRRWVLLAAVAAGAVGLMAPSGVRAQVVQNPNEAGEQGKKPFVLMVMDSSASMEWTSEGAEMYPERDYAPLGVGITDDPYPSQPDEYRPKDALHVSDSGDLARPPDYKSNPIMYGSCMVWEPPCSEYERPSWNPSSLWTSHYNPATPMGERFEVWMRGKESVFNTVKRAGGAAGDQLEFPVRLLNHTQPRHVTFKEILTGEMVLKPNGLRNQSVTNIDHRIYGPGCWLVPRMRGIRTRGDPICCKKSSDGVCQKGYPKFEQYPDRKDPRPHFQEVFDAQLGNGLMDNLSGEIFFGTAAFDSYKWPQDGQSYGTKGLDFEDTVDWPPNHLEDEIQGSFRNVRESDPGTYNLGVYRIAAPETFEVPGRYMQDLSLYSQVSLLDAGTLKAKAENSSSFDLDPTSAPSPLGFSFRHGLENYIGSTSKPFKLSRQPISRNTPLAPTMHDIHQFFSQPSNAINRDRFKQCRPKHVMLMTDGVPLPERPQEKGKDGHCVDIGKGSLSGAFRFDPKKYKYRCTEEMIRDFVQGKHSSNYMVGQGQADPEYDPRVHVIGLNRGVGGGTRSKKALAKLGSMAKAGKTCAGFVLQDGSGKGPWIPKPNGKCRRDDHPCLVPQPTKKFNFVSFSNPSNTGTCEYPALVLRCNGDIDPPSTVGEKEAYRRCKDSKWFSRAFQQMFNSILKSSGLSSRTTPAITNRLDDPGRSAGGQYRLYSGVKVTEGNPYWKGVMFREKRLCSASSGQLQQLNNQGGPCSQTNDRYDCMHEDIEDQVGGQTTTGETNVDTRRIFTSVPDESVYNYDQDRGKSANADACGRFHSTFHLEEDGGRGEFQQSYMETNGGSTQDLVAHKRVPFATETLRNALVGQAGNARDKPLSGANSVASALKSYFKVSSLSALETLVAQVRGHVADRRDRVLGAILNSDPVTVEPPSKDVPIDSYRDFKSKFADRPTMLYVSTLDGMLHAIHTGVMDQNPEQVRVRDRAITPDQAGENLTEVEGSAKDQREAWAYIPHMLHDQLSAQYGQGNPTLMDGAPVVKNVRLCHGESKYNQNVQACRAICEQNDGSLDSMCTQGSSSCVPDAMQWRSVLVQGLGQAGSGYFAVDVTRPGGPYTDDNKNTSVERPDPIPLWEFDPNWEQGQIEHMVSNDFPLNGEELVYPPKNWRDTHDPSSKCSDNENDSDYFWKQSFMGQSVGKPAVGTVMLPGLGNDANIKRPVAIFTGGGPADRNTCDIGMREGRAIYVVDLQTGSLLRRFVGYRDANGWKRFDAQVMGSPSLFDNSTGQLVTRGFVGDSKGRLFRLDLSEPNPADWEVSLFFDPKDKVLSQSTSKKLGPATLKPAVAMNQQQNLVVVYGLGEPGDETPKGETQMLLAARETEDAIAKNEQGSFLWSIRPDNLLKKNEKITGEPVIFNQTVYFTSYYLQQNDLCGLGRSRIWGVEMSDQNSTLKNVPDGTFECNSGKLANLNKSRCTSRYFEPEEDTLIRGLTITLGPACSLTGSDASSAEFQSGSDQKPRLIAQTGSADPGNVGGTKPGSSQSGSVINRVETSIDSPSSQTIPLSWTVISQ